MVNGSRNGARSGAQTLILLAAPLNSVILRTLADGPKQQAELRRTGGTPAQTTLRAQLKKLEQIGAVEKQRRNRFPGVLEYELTAAGRDLLFVTGVLERWLAEAPDGPRPLGDSAAKATIKAVADGWSATMLRALAAQSLSLTELDGIIASLSYPALERRLSAMRLAGQVEACRGNGRGRPYAVTGWLRRGMAPLAAAARWERRHLAKTTSPIGGIDIETVFLLAAPLLRLPRDFTGSCRIAAAIPRGKKPRLAGVTVEVKEGEVASYSTELRGTPQASALGSAGAWLSSVVEHDTGGLELDGEHRFARALIDGLHTALFGAKGQKTISTHHP